jgi:hypothetical protein
MDSDDWTVLPLVWPAVGESGRREPLSPRHINIECIRCMSAPMMRLAECDMSPGGLKKWFVCVQVRAPDFGWGRLTKSNSILINALLMADSRPYRKRIAIEWERRTETLPSLPDGHVCCFNHARGNRFNEGPGKKKKKNKKMAL